MAITALMAGSILTPLDEIENGVILMDGHRIVAVGARDAVNIPAGAAVIDHQDRILTPGFIDMHIHGAAGHDFMEATPAALGTIGAFLARHGTTSYVATTVTASIERTIEAATGLGEIIRSWSSTDSARKPAAAQPIGIHFEGPFLNTIRRGAHPAADIQKPNLETLKRILDATAGAALVLALAPELESALDLLAHARNRGVRVGIGHSNSTYEEAERGIDAGATHAVHLYNAMRPFSHRDPGIIGAALTDDRLSAELICDGLHVEPPAVRLLVRAKGLKRVILITDSLSATGMPDGSYQLGQFTINVVDGVCRTAEGNLAGSSIVMEQALRNLEKFTGFSFKECLPCATLNPARLLGVENQKGVIAVGADADFAVLDANYVVKQAYVRGRPAAAPA
ncbi:MAG TPA: N-acetylglucosamine-6-phosphate deacetylase [Terriglobia bacterium]|nr:N-acetylglucosamine-6-phosphate deacetylase [Terriglobia bacterium]